MRLIERTLSGATSPVQIGPGRDGNKEALCILQMSNNDRASLSDDLVSYLWNLLGDAARVFYSPSRLSQLMLLNTETKSKANWLSRLGL